MRQEDPNRNSQPQMDTGPVPQIKPVEPKNATKESKADAEASQAAAQIPNWKQPRYKSAKVRNLVHES